MIKTLKKLKESTFKAIPVIVGMILLSAVINFYVAKQDTEKMKDYWHEMSIESKEVSWNTIETIIELSNQTARENSRVVAQRLDQKILSEYKDIDDLEDQFETGGFKSDFYKILKTNFYDVEHNPLFPSPYQTIVGFNGGVISIFSNEGDIIRTPQTKEVLPWSSFYTLYPNQRSVESAIVSVKSKDSGVIIIQRDVVSSDRFVGDESVSMTDLKNIYDTGGVEALRDFNILAPAYIRDNGDIFGNDDKNFMKTTKNYKLFIIQSTNIGDVLDRYQTDIDKQTTHLSTTEEYVSDYIYHKNIQTILWSFVLFIISVILIFIYNQESRRCRQSCPSSNQGDHKN